MSQDLTTDEFNAIPIAELASRFVDSLPPYTAVLMDGHMRINRAEACAEAFQAFIASSIAMLIDAGSERDAVMEDENLRKALVEACEEWT